MTDPNWLVHANLPVTAVAFAGNRVQRSGSFSSVDGVRRLALAEVFGDELPMRNVFE